LTEPILKSSRLASRSKKKPNMLAATTAAAVDERLSSVKNSAESDKLPAFFRTLRA
jgi:hypothetical protein